MCYGLRDREPEGEARRRREEKTREQGQKAEDARWAEEEKKPLTEEVREMVSGVG